MNEGCLPTLVITFDLKAYNKKVTLEAVISKRPQQRDKGPDGGNSWYLMVDEQSKKGARQVLAVNWTEEDRA